VDEVAEVASAVDEGSEAAVAASGADTGVATEVADEVSPLIRSKESS
jgi:hypothetical protein